MKKLYIAPITLNSGETSLAWAETPEKLNKVISKWEKAGDAWRMKEGYLECEVSDFKAFNWNRWQ